MACACGPAYRKAGRNTRFSGNSGLPVHHSCTARACALNVDGKALTGDLVPISMKNECAVEVTLWKTHFPENFLWGAATSAYQIEGSPTADGGGKSIWDRFCHIPGTIANGDTGDIACDSYRRPRRTWPLLKKLGARAYRFSVSWPWVDPLGTETGTKRASVL